MENYVGPNEQQRERQAYIKQIDDREAKDIIQADAAAIAGDWKYLETHIQASGDAVSLFRPDKVACCSTNPDGLLSSC